MLYTELERYIYSEMRFELTSDQRKAVEGLAQFCMLPSEHKVFVLKGYAGTGKTTVVSALIKALRRVNVPTMLLAPTGRAAKVLGGYAGQSAFSIHRIIYRQKRAGATEFDLNFNGHRDTLFIVDEASMIANSVRDGLTFGSGRLLDDLIEYVYSGAGCSMILLGDTAQLLPIGSSSSPALDVNVLGGYGLDVFGCLLKDVVRQTGQSGILYNATLLRRIIETGQMRGVKFRMDFPDVQRVTGEMLIDEIQASYNTVGEENTIILTYSNKRAVLYNRGVRNAVLYREDELSNGDFLMVTRNNYYWSEKYDGLDFIANGDIAEVVRVGHHADLYGVRFADLTLRLVDYDMEITAKVLIDSLYADTQEAVGRLNQQLAENVAEDYADIGDRRRLWCEMQKNEYFNALQVKFAYAITGHKAQGGGWQHVYVDQGYLTDEMLTLDYCQWLYTAFTRAQTKLFLVNFSDRFF